MVQGAKKHEMEIHNAIEACRTLMKALSDPHIQPLEREAGYLLAKALQHKVEELGLLDEPEVQEFLQHQKTMRSPRSIRRFPQDFSF